MKSKKKIIAVKKKHTKKSLILTTKKRKIHYISKIHIGKEHDYSILKKEFPPDKKWFKGKEVRIDLGFQGFQNLYDTKKTYLPFKKKRVAKGEDNSLTPQQIKINKEQAQERIYVEHSIGGMKRFNILHNQIRIKSDNKINAIIGICAGLWNFLIH